MIDVAPHVRGAVLRVRAQPGAKKDALLGERAGALRVSVCAAPERGKANEAVVELLATSLGLKRSAITLIAGETSRDKRFLIEGVSTTDLQARLAAIAPAGSDLGPSSSV
jgi:hypothetical protein